MSVGLPTIRIDALARLFVQKKVLASEARLESVCIAAFRTCFVQSLERSRRAAAVTLLWLRFLRNEVSPCQPEFLGDSKDQDVDG